MAKVGLVIRPGIIKAVELGQELIEWAYRNGHDLLLEEETSFLVRSLRADPTGNISRAVEAISSPTQRKLSSSALAGEADVVVVLGGDGTLIGVARYVTREKPLLLGVNFGTLGFLTEIAPAEMMSTVEAVFNGSAETGERRMILARVMREGRCVFESQSINDVVVQKGAQDRLLPLDLSVDGEAVMRLRADGIIFATPTGSTAYSLAAGGSILYPSLSAVMVTPICAHALTIRPLILDMASELRVSVPEYDGKVFLTIDGQVSEPLFTGDSVVIRKAPNTVRIVRSASKTYFAILRNKLNWGLGNKAE